MKVCFLLCLAFLEVCRAQRRIVGGADARIEEWPFMVLMVFSRPGKLGPACGASLLGSRTILTAAHCLDDVTGGKTHFRDFLLFAYMGHTEILKATTKRRVVDYATHPAFRSGALGHDIAVCFLARPAVFSPSVKRVILKTTPLGAEERRLMAAGWGAWTNPVDQRSPLSLRLKFVEQELLPGSQCFAKIPALQNDSLCAGTADSKEYVFTGDAGGPLVTLDYQQIGIVSYKFKEDNGRTIFTSIPHYVDWLAEASKQLFRAHCGAKNNATPGY